MKIQISVEVTPTQKLKKGDIFLWESTETGRQEIHVCHSDLGYGVQTYSKFHQNDKGYVVVNYSGVRGIVTSNTETGS